MSLSIFRLKAFIRLLMFALPIIISKGVMRYSYSGGDLHVHQNRILSDKCNIKAKDYFSANNFGQTD